MSATSAVWLMSHSYHHFRTKREAVITSRDEHQLINGTILFSSQSTSMLIDINVTDNGSTTVQNTKSYELSVQDEVVLSLHGIIFLLALAGNGLVIATFAQNIKMRTITNMFLLNLAISDLLLAIFCMPFTVIPVILEDFVFGPVMCVMIRYLQAMSVSASAFTLVAISLERFYAICNPLTSRKWQHMGHSYKVIAIIWILALVMNIPMAVFNKIKTYPISGAHECQDVWPKDVASLRMAYYVFQLIVADLVVPLTIMSIAYGLIARTLWMGFKAMNSIETPDTLAIKAKRQMSLTSDTSDISDESEIPLTGGLTPVTSPNGVNLNGGSMTSPTGSESTRFHFTPHSQHSRQSKPLVKRQETNNSMRSHSSRSNIRSKKRVIKMLFVIVVEFFVCWTPLYVVYVWVVLDRQSITNHMHNPQLTLSMLRLLAYASSCCNPITYCFMSKKFRSAFLTAFRCRKEAKPLHRRATIQSTQVSYCESHPPVKTRLLSTHSMSSFHNKPHLSVVNETSSTDNVNGFT